ncbi:hypothetical protein SAMN04488058_12511 [Deinococcus reticulitermitis]|uniref:Uncharacterized protein n=1 Tax=Deinococcus reticulitermitis TaxID=856736 RepID=A0A1H7CHC2_9DEIO|nr:hypothetical protein [Deinococcus reticulitermitis]SEJ86532.1 hypothetical protein SAMN04488058_12511 [Deinococcus reticulitermitis]
MLLDLGTVLGAGGPGSADRAALRRAVVEDNVLGKRTARTRLASWQRLNRLYGLSDQAPLNRAFLSLWKSAPEARPQLALLRALERDALLRLSAPWIVAQPPGQAVTPAALAAELTRLGVVYSEKTLRSISQNLLSSWAQVGWLTGKVAKRRAAVTWHPAAAAFLLYGAYLTGHRGAGLYDTPLAHLLGLDAEQLDALAFAASQERLLSYRRLADVVEITFPGWDADDSRGPA